MTPTPRVSVVMPVYNGERFIAEAVESVLASEFRDLELLVLDDGSTDRSIEAAEHAARKDGRLRVIRLPHAGVAAARNAGLRESRGALIANLDADDLMFARRLTRQVAYLDSHPECVAVGSRALVIDSAGRPVQIGVSHFTHEEIDGAHMEGRAGAMWNPTVTFRRQAAVDVGGYGTALHSTGEDFDLWLRLAEVGRLVNMPEVLVEYRIHGANISLDAEDRPRRVAVRLETLGRAFVRRGISDRHPVERPGPRPRRADRIRDDALLRFFSGDRAGGVLRVLAACILSPTAPATTAAVRMVVGGQMVRAVATTVGTRENRR